MTIKLIHNIATGNYYSDDRAPEGGICLRQRAMFSHIWPRPMFYEIEREIFEHLALIHGWDISTESK